jgi:hypothetical protein
MVSTAGDRTSVYFRNLRDQLVDAIDQDRPHDGTMFLEWSPPDGVTGEDAWPWSCPSLGYGNVTADRLRALVAGMKPGEAARAYENRWDDTGSSVWVREGPWTAAAVAQLPEGGAPFVAVESARSAADEVARYGIVVARLTPGGVVAVTGTEVEGEAALWATVDTLDGVLLLPPGLARRHPFTGHDGANLRDVRTVGARELRATSDEVRAWIARGNVVHLADDDDLTGQVLAARRWIPADAPGADLRSPDPIHLARALVWAVAEAVRADPPLQAPVLRLA